MTDDLFPTLPATLSPKLAWMARHNIQTLPPVDGGNEESMDAAECWDGFGFDPLQWLACQGEMNPASPTLVSGNTEEAALLKLASKLKLEFYR